MGNTQSIDLNVVWVGYIDERKRFYLSLNPIRVAEWAERMFWNDPFIVAWIHYDQK